jgi:hypothetical protein
MSISRQADHYRIVYFFCLLMTLLFSVLSVGSCLPGEQIYSQTFTDDELSNEEPKDHYGSFTLEKRQVVQLDVSSPNLDNSWLWLKTAILDEKDRVVADKTFDIQYYSGYQTGESWSEGDRDTYAIFTLPAGTYKLLAYAQDAERRQGYTAPMNERIRITVYKGIVLARYFMMGAIFFLIFAFLARRWGRKAAEKRQSELADLEVFDTVVWEGGEYDVGAHLQYDENGWYWDEYALHGDDETLWLTVNEPEDTITLWREIDDLELPESPPPRTLEHRGIHYTQIETGRAEVETTGETQGRKEGRQMKYADYESADGEMLSVGKWPSGIEMSIGREISPYDITIRDDSTRDQA